MLLILLPHEWQAPAAATHTHTDTFLRVFRQERSASTVSRSVRKMQMLRSPFFYQRKNQQAGIHIFFLVQTHRSISSSVYLSPKQLNLAFPLSVLDNTPKKHVFVTTLEIAQSDRNDPHLACATSGCGNDRFRHAIRHDAFATAGRAQNDL